MGSSQCINCILIQIMIMYIQSVCGNSMIVSSQMDLLETHNKKCSVPEMSLTLGSKLACAAACQIHSCDVMCVQRLDTGVLCELCNRPVTFMDNVVDDNYKIYRNVQYPKGRVTVFFHGLHHKVCF